jgi:hypothetical protein
VGGAEGVSVCCYVSVCAQLWWVAVVGDGGMGGAHPPYLDGQPVAGHGSGDGEAAGQGGVKACANKPRRCAEWVQVAAAPR